jgi:YbbR domain-containing protein
VLTVTGPEEIVNSIDKVVATANISGVSTDFTESVIPKFYDSDGNLVDSKELTLSVSTVSVSVHFVNTKTVDVVVKTSGTLSSDLTLGSIKTNPSSVMIIGEASELNNVANITIPDTVINLSNITGSFMTTVDIGSYLPEGVELTEGTSSKVTIYVLMENETMSTTHVSASNIELRNIPEGLAAALTSDKIEVNIFGTEDAIAALNASDITGYIDCSGLSEGENQNVVLQCENLDGITVQNTSVTVDVVKDESTNGTDSNKTEED